MSPDECWPLVSDMSSQGTLGRILNQGPESAVLVSLELFEACETNGLTGKAQLCDMRKLLAD